MKNMIFIVVCAAACGAWAVGVKPAEPKDVPPLMMTASGESVTTVEQWEKTRRPEILETFRKNVYGVRKVERPADLAFMEIAQPEV